MSKSMQQASAPAQMEEEVSDLDKVSKGGGAVGDIVGTGLAGKAAAEQALSFKDDILKGKFKGKKGNVRKKAIAKALLRGSRTASSLAGSTTKAVKSSAEFAKAAGIGSAGAATSTIAGATTALPIISMITGGIDVAHGGLSMYSAYKRRKQLNTIGEDALGQGLDAKKEEDKQKLEDRNDALNRLKGKQDKKMESAGFKMAIGTLGLASGALTLAGLGPAGLALGLAGAAIGGGRAAYKAFRQWRNNRSQTMLDRNNMTSKEVLQNKKDALNQKIEEGNKVKGWLNPLNWYKKYQAKSAGQKLAKLNRYENQENAAADKAKLQEKVEAGEKASGWNPLNWGKKYDAWKAKREMKEIDKFANYGDVKKKQAEDYTKKNEEAKNQKGIGGWFKRLWYGDADKSEKAEKKADEKTATTMLEWNNSAAMESLGLNEDKKETLAKTKFGKSWSELTNDERKEIITKKLGSYGNK